jgi:hypothetical protein
MSIIKWLMSFLLAVSVISCKGEIHYNPDSGNLDADNTDSDSPDSDNPESDNDLCDQIPVPSDDQAGTPDLGTTLIELRTYSTLHSIGFEWDIEGDSNHNGLCSVRYRKKGDCLFKEGLNLLRNDYAWFYNDKGADEPANNLAGSLMFLTPGTTYEIVLELSDPDGGQAMRVLEFATRPIPQKPVGGQTWHVVPGNGGGDGTENTPFLGIAAADAVAQPGDIVRLHQGSYQGSHTLSASGSPEARIVWEPAGDGAVVLEQLEIEASHVWLDALTFEPITLTDAIRGVDAASDVVITNCNFTGYEYTIFLGNGSSNWIITDNTIVGDNPPGVGLGDSGDLSGEGVQLPGSNGLPGAGGHVVAYNRISQIADAVSGGYFNSDIYGNDLFDFADDAIEPDQSYANIRVWGNRAHDAAAYLISFQPQKLGPWYFIRNQVAGANYGIFKFRTQDRFVFVNNTFASSVYMAQYLMKTVSRNNLYIHPSGGVIWTGRDTSAGSNSLSPPQWEPSWNTDVDYDGFDWGTNSIAFAWRDYEETYPDIESFSAAIGVEQHGIRVDKNVIFEDFFVPAERASVPREMLTLNPGTNAVDSGAIVPNLADVYEGSAPDLGAYEVGRPLPHFGPRTGDAASEHATYWAWH